MKMLEFAIYITTFLLLVGMLIYGLMILSDAIDGINAAIESGLLPECVRDAITGLALLFGCALAAMLLSVQRKSGNIEKKCEQGMTK